MKQRFFLSGIIGLFFSLMVSALCAQSNDREAFVQHLLDEMTLEEKIGQLSLLNIDTEGISIREAVKNGTVGGIINETRPEVLAELQELARSSRLGIPLLVSRDIIHGYRVIYPIPLGLAAGFDPELVERLSSLTAKQARRDGINWTFSPMVDISRDPRWGRVAESFGEDTYLSSVMGSAMVRGYQQQQGNRIGGLASCVKHFAGYGAAEGGRDYNSVEISEHGLREYYLPPFKACIEAGSPALMAGFHDLNGRPVTGDGWLLTEILRKEWQFGGFVVSDWESVAQLQVHGIARDAEDAVLQAINAGCEMEMASQLYPAHLSQLLSSGKISHDQITRAVRRILQLKYDLGLFGKQEFAAPDNHQLKKLAEEAAAKSFVLLKNESEILPIQFANKNILVVGPMADAPHDQMGTWSLDGIENEVITPLDYLQNNLPTGCKLAYLPGLKNTRDLNTAEFSALSRAARKADLILCFAGEEAILSGESHSRANLRLPGAQEEMIRTLKKSGKPLVLIVLAGRPLVLTSILSECDALLYAWAPGTMGGPAIIKTLGGEIAPSGKLPISFPAHEGQIPIYYNHRNTGKPAVHLPAENQANIQNSHLNSAKNLQQLPEKAPQFSVGNTSQYLDYGSQPLFPFGYGLTYGELILSEMELSAKELFVGDTLTITCKITNPTQIELTEVIQLYLQDCHAEIARTLRELKDFQRIRLAPGESRQITFQIHENQLKYHHLNQQYFADEGLFKLFLGTSSDANMEQSFTFRKSQTADYQQLQAIPVQVVKTKEGYAFLREGKEYFVKGAGLEHGNIEELAKRGGNSFRTWRTGYPGPSGKKTLDEAHRLGLTVAMGLEIPAERHGFDYNDSVAVEKLISRLQVEVLSYKDHPALLCWLAGNELNLESRNPQVWKVLHRIISMIHSLDPNHPVSTTLAGMNVKDIRLIEKYCPNLNFYSFQMYGDIDHLPIKLKELKWNKPYLITEWGATGHWEVAVTKWNRPLEQNSSEKAEAFLRRYQQSILADRNHCLGSYAFLWGQKQERTPTWYGLFLESGEITPAIESLEYAWTGKYSGNRSPQIKQFTINNLSASNNIELEAGKEYQVNIIAIDPEADLIQYQWEIRTEVIEMSVGGDFERSADILDNLIEPDEIGNAKLRAPKKAGEYRLFVYLRDGKNHAATANIPFYVIEYQSNKQ